MQLCVLQVKDTASKFSSLIPIPMKPLVFALTLASLTPFVLAETGVVFESSFETPAAIEPRTPKSKGGTIANQGKKPEWLQFEDQPVAVPAAALEPQPAAGSGTASVSSSGGGIVAGVTSEMARTGEQCLYLEANQLSVPYAGIAFSSAPIKIVPGKEYIVGIWGRNDPKKPLVAGSPQLFLKLQVDFFSDEGVTQTGDSEYLLQALPGSPGYTLTFVDGAWRQLRKRVVAPADASHMIVTYRCDLSPDKGSVSGVMYFDDVTVEGELPDKGDLQSATEKKAAAAASEAVPASHSATEGTAAPAKAPGDSPASHSKKRKAHVQP